MSARPCPWEQTNVLLAKILGDSKVAANRPGQRIRAPSSNTPLRPHHKDCRKDVSDLDPWDPHTNSCKTMDNSLNHTKSRLPFAQQLINQRRKKSAARRNGAVKRQLVEASIAPNRRSRSPQRVRQSSRSTQRACCCCSRCQSP